MSKPRSYTDEEKAQILQEVKSTGNVAAVAKKNSVPTSTIHTWIKPKSGKKDKSSVLSSREVKILKGKLKDSELENKILKELLKKTYQVWDTD